MNMQLYREKHTKLDTLYKYMNQSEWRARLFKLIYAETIHHKVHHNRKWYGLMLTTLLQQLYFLHTL